MALVPALLLTLFGIALRGFGYGVPTSFTITWTLGAERRILSNHHFGKRFFGPQLSRTPLPFSLDMEKPQGVCRIFLLGGSAARGFPEPAYGMGRLLQIMLEDAYPGVRFEIINTAMTAINSHVVVPVIVEKLPARCFFVRVYDRPQVAGTMLVVSSQPCLVKTKADHGENPHVREEVSLHRRHPFPEG